MSSPLEHRTLPQHCQPQLGESTPELPKPPRLATPLSPGAVSKSLALTTLLPLYTLPGHTGRDARPMPSLTGHNSDVKLSSACVLGHWPHRITGGETSMARVCEVRGYPHRRKRKPRPRGSRGEDHGPARGSRGGCGCSGGLLRCRVDGPAGRSEVGTGPAPSLTSRHTSHLSSARDGFPVTSKWGQHGGW